MLLWISGLIALVLGLLIGFLVRNSSASAQIAAARAEKPPLEQRNAELTRDLGAAKDELARVQAESAARAGFEALAVERGKTIEESRADFLLWLLLAATASLTTIVRMSPACAAL